jgi:hypothetical protein
MPRPTPRTAGFLPPAGPRLRCWALLVGALLGAVVAPRGDAAPTRDHAAAREILARMTREFARINDYGVVVQTESAGGTSKFQLEFLRRRSEQQANRFRVRVLAGRFSGDEWVLREDGSVRARGSAGERRDFPVTLLRDDPRLKDPEGVWLGEWDFGSMVNRLVAVYNAGPPECAVERIGRKKLKRWGWDDEPGANRVTMGYTRGRLHVQHAVLVSDATGMPLEYRLENDGRLALRYVFHDFRKNTNPNARLFEF